MGVELVKESMAELSNQVKTNRIKGPGIFQSLEVSDGGIRISTDIEVFTVRFYRSNIVRIHHQTEEKDTNPFSVIEVPQEVNFTVEENDDSIMIVGEEFDLAVRKNPILFTFLTKEGKIINQDEDGLGTESQGDQTTVYKKLQKGERFVGLGEKTGGLDRRGSGYQNWNTDHFAYEVEADPLYSTIPFYIGVHNSLSYGIFVDNTYKSHFNFGASNNRFSSFSTDAGDMDYYFFSGAVEEIIQSYTWLTGRMPMPPMWSLGYQQCRYSYYPDSEVVDVAKKFRTKEIPADVIVLDIHHMDGFKIFSWDEKNFPNPKVMIQTLKDLGFEVVVICDPGIKIEENYKPYHSGVENDIFIKYRDGQMYEGEVWPGWCHFPDFTKEESRSWWKEMMKSYTDVGVKGFWNDMNEIATWGQMLPENIEFDMNGETATTRKARNVYGLQMTQASYEGATANLGNERPFALTRAGFSGVQRYSAMWTGDNVANDDHMLLGVRLVSSLGLSGIAFAGYDVGGFVGNGDRKLFARWIQLGAFSPMYRGHSMINSHDSEPWSYGEEVEEISANYIKLRYKLLPYLYSCFLHASETGVPVVRSLAIDYTHDDQVYDQNFENQYLFGPSIMVAPMKSDDQYAKVYLPGESWFEFFTDEKYPGGQEMIKEYPLEKLPLFVKESAIVPIYAEAGSNTRDVGALLELHLYNGTQSNFFEYYEDDGTSFDYREGTFHRRSISFSPEKKNLILNTSTGSYPSKMKKLKLVFHGFTKEEIEVLDAQVKSESYSFLTPISNFDPVEKRETKHEIENVLTVTTDYQADEMTFNW